MKDYTLTVGLEIHAQLATETKMFCSSKNDPDEKRPNVNICPVCMAHPGTLPVINKEAVRSVLRLGVAVGGNIADYTEFDRKNYFYPDIPKGYQISQYKYPLVSRGEIAGVPLTRIHLEEDTARSTHPEGKEGRDYSLLDFNRAGTPLMELVTEPAIHSAETASNFARELQLLLLYLGISHANMEKGEMRIEANISVSQGDTLGTKVEVKNLNSFKAVEKAIKYESERHISLLEKGEKVMQETRGWNENKEETFSQRAKEESHDYRYFPDPDLPKLFISEIPEFSEKALKESLPKLPSDYRSSLKNEYNLKDEDIEMYVRNEFLRNFFISSAEGATPELAQLISNYTTTNITDPENSKATPEAMRELMEMTQAGELSSRGAKDVLNILQELGGNARQIAEEKGLMQKSNEGELKKIAEEIISNNSNVVEEYKKGKESSLQYLIGQAMKETKGSGNPQVLKKIFEELLK